jgi:cation-transporting P-type ATPase I
MRKTWSHDGYAYIAVEGWEDLARAEIERLERTLEAIPGVRWAAWNGALQRVVVAFEAPATSRQVAAAARKVAPKSGVDPEKPIVHALSLAADVAGTAYGLAGELLRLPSLPPELAALSALFDHLPVLGERISRAVGKAPATIGMGLLNSVIGALSHSPLRPFAGGVARAAVLPETLASHQAWQQRVARLHPTPDAARAEPLSLPPRPAPMPDGPIERHASWITTLSLLVAAASLPFAQGVRRAARALAIGSPRPGLDGREAFAATLGQLLAKRGVLLRDNAALRRLDRIDTVVIDAATLHNGRTMDPLAAVLIGAAAKRCSVVVAGDRKLASQLSVSGTIAGGPKVTESVRSLQKQGHAVMLIAHHNDVALAASDCGVGILRHDHRPPWGAHVMCGPGLAEAWLLLESLGAARRVSAGSARIAFAGAGAGAVTGLLSRDPGRQRLGMAAPNVATLATVAFGTWIAQRLGTMPLPVAEPQVPWHSLDPEEVLRRLNSSITGLSNREASHRLSAVAPEHDTEKGAWDIVADELNNPLTIPLAAGAAVAAAIGSRGDALLVLAVLGLNAILGTTQQLVVRRSVRRLRGATTLPAKVRRNGQDRVLSAEQLVQGDIITLVAGDSVPADCRLIETDGLEVDESSLTGESLPVGKGSPATLAPPVADRTSMVYAGTTVAAGTATGVVVAVGRATEAGRGIALAESDRKPSGVEVRLRRITKASLPIAAGASAAVLGAGLLHGRFQESLNAAVALAVAAIPEGLPSVATMAQLSAVRRLSRHNVLVRQPRALEALGRVDVVCFDKTGTLTEGRIELTHIFDGNGAAPDTPPDKGRHVLAAALRATPECAGGDTLPHPTDQAVVSAARSEGVAADLNAAGWRTVRELPFEPGRGFHAVLGATARGQLLSVKGAPETILPRCDMSTLDSEQVHNEIEGMARKGLRVLAVAQRAASTRRQLDDERIDRLEFIGLLGFSDPVRSTAAEAIEALRRAGVRVIMLTGDHPSTAKSIAAELGLDVEAGVITGVDVNGDNGERHFERGQVFARVSPADKVAVVKALRGAGHVVAVTGDGANDAPAIRLADVGIALGNQATTAAREAADIIIADDRIETIVRAIIEGRALWTSVREAVALLLGGNLGEIGFSVAGSLLSGAGPPLSARQLLLVNLVTDLLPALALATRPPRGLSPDDLVREGPDASLGAALNDQIAQRAVATSVGALAGWSAAGKIGGPRFAGTVGLVSLVGSQLAQTAVASRGDPIVLGASMLSALATLAAVQVPGLSTFFGSRPLGPIGWSIAAGASGVGAFLGSRPLESIGRTLNGYRRLLPSATWRR